MIFLTHGSEVCMLFVCEKIGRNSPFRPGIYRPNNHKDANFYFVSILSREARLSCVQNHLQNSNNNIILMGIWNDNKRKVYSRDISQEMIVRTFKCLWLVSNKMKLCPCITGNYVTWHMHYTQMLNICPIFFLKIYHWVGKYISFYSIIFCTYTCSVDRNHLLFP